MRCLHLCLLIAVLLSGCRSGPDAEFVPIKAVYPDLQAFAISEFEDRGIQYRITEEGILEVDFARAEDVVEIVTGIWETHLPSERSFSINPDYLSAFRAALDEESIPYRSLSADELEWTVVDEPDAAEAQRILDRVFGVGPEDAIRDRQ